MTKWPLALLCVVLASAPAWAQTPRGGTPPRTPARQAPPANSRGYVFVDVAQPVSSADFENTLEETINAETAEFTSQYGVGARPGLLAAGGIWLGRKRMFGVGGGVYVASRAATLDVDASIPHPLYFNRPREVSGSLDGLAHQEFAFLVQARLERPLTRTTKLTVFGGPAFFHVTQDLFESLNYSESYPYDTVSFLSLTTTSASGSAVGFNGGVDVAYYFTPKIGVGGGGQYLGGTATLQDSAGNDVDVKVGGFLVSGGLRYRF